AAALCEPHVAEPAPEEPALSLVRRRRPECAEAPVDDLRVDALPVVRTDELVLPAAKRGQAEPPQGGPPGLDEGGIGRADAELDAPQVPARGGDGCVGVRRQLRDDLGQVDPGLGKVLAEVAPPDAA